MNRSTNLISADGRAHSLHITSAEEADACAHVEYVEGELVVEGAHFAAPKLAHVGMPRVGWGGKAELPKCKTVGGSVQVWGDGSLDIACEVIVGAVLCSQTARLRMPECKTVGQEHARSIRLVQSSIVEAPKLQRVDGGVDVIDQASLKAPYVAMAHAHAAMVAAQRLIDKAVESGALTANGPNRPVKLSARLMKSGLESMSATIAATVSSPAKAPRKTAALDAVDPLAGADSRPTRRARP